MRIDNGNFVPLGFYDKKRLSAKAKSFDIQGTQSVILFAGS